MHGPGHHHGQHPKRTPFIHPHQSLPSLLAGGGSFSVPDSSQAQGSSEQLCSGPAQTGIRAACRVSSGAQLQAPKLGIVGESGRRSQQCVFCCLQHSLHPAWCLPLHSGPGLLTHVQLVTQWQQQQPLLAQQLLPAGLLPPNQHLTLTESFSQPLHHHFSIYQGSKPLHRF